ncbi:hypothetical protein [Desertivirga arenae]|uniref:hypothetical protein n=1 Tax=Desertivirga arenae TaxID=2810309 RepID=UPI001A96DCF1|nr:hypothetical protein [Pedobacter sp. SYSU D00823]
MKTQKALVGLTKDAGWQFGLRKTFSYSKEYLWDFMFSKSGLVIWLGEIEDELEIKKAYLTGDGIEGTVTTLTPYSHVRMSWKKKEWNNFSALQVRIIGDREKATISFHQDKLLSNDQREEMKLYWNQKLAEIELGLRTKGYSEERRL